MGNLNNKIVYDPIVYLKGCTVILCGVSVPFCIPLMFSFYTESMLRQHGCRVATETRDLSETQNLHAHVTFGQRAEHVYVSAQSADTHAYDTRVRIVLTCARPSSRVLGT